MKNAEKLAKDTQFMVNACMNCTCLVSCDGCPLSEGNGVCRARAGHEEELKEWLESEAEEDAKYIDRDELIKILQRIIEDLKTSDGQEVKHGKWKDGFCTNCGGYQPFFPFSNERINSRFCFTCGARMDGEQNDDR